MGRIAQTERGSRDGISVMGDCFLMAWAVHCEVRRNGWNLPAALRRLSVWW